MKPTLFFLLIFNFFSAQNPDLLNNNWEITKIVNESSPAPFLPPPMPYQQITTFSTTSLNSSFFNTVFAQITYSGQDQFTVNSKACTLADYMDDNGEVNQFFGLVCNFFGSYNFFYTIQNNGNEKTLVISSPIFSEIHFKSKNLGVNDKEVSHFILAPNPVKSSLTVKNLNGISSAKIFDISGKLVRELKSENAKTLNIDMKDLQTGTYFIKLNNDKTFKIIKE